MGFHTVYKIILTFKIYSVADVFKLYIYIYIYIDTKFYI